MTENCSVPVALAAKIYRKDPCWIRAGLISGWLPIGFATRNGERITSTREIGSKKGRINYYISPKLLFEQTGFDYLNQRNAKNQNGEDFGGSECQL